MNKKIGIVLVFVLLAGAVFLSGCNQEEVAKKLNRQAVSIGDPKPFMTMECDSNGGMGGKL